MKTFLSISAAVIALVLTGIKLTSGAYPEAQALLKEAPAGHQVLVRSRAPMSGFRV